MFRHIHHCRPFADLSKFRYAGTILGEGGFFIGRGDASVPSCVLLEVGRQNLRYTYLIWVPGGVSLLW